MVIWKSHPNVKRTHNDRHQKLIKILKSIKGKRGSTYYKKQTKIKQNVLRKGRTLQNPIPLLHLIRSNFKP